MKLLLVETFEVLSSSFLLCTHVQSWDLFFRNANAGQAHAPQLLDQLEGKASFLQSHGLAQTPGKAEKVVEDHLAVQSLIRAYQVSVAWGRGGVEQASFADDLFLSFNVVVCLLVLTLACCLASYPKHLKLDCFFVPTQCLNT